VKNLFVVAVENVAVCMQDNRLRKDSGVKYVFEANTICDFWLKVSDSMGVGRIFSREGPLLDFTKFLLGGGKSGEICFFLLETKQTTFFAEIFKIQGGASPCPSLLPMLMSDSYPYVRKEALKCYFSFPAYIYVNLTSLPFT